MGSIGPSEVLVVLLVALIVLGPNRLPDAARQLGRAVAELRRLSAGFQEDMRGAFEEATRTPAPSYGDEPRPEPPPAVDGDALPPLPGLTPGPPAGGYGTDSDAPGTAPDRHGDER
ncbi:MAG TPA: twin-arginine translocase TatA/TatE family subunit [Acidimicrobiales bacterium]|nr:twin-arginine translocase TatA/TatE family subunit [Acidimicrobiales bacterium]